MPSLSRRVFSSLLTPLLYANIAALGLGGLWLGAVAQWQVIWVGFMGLMLSPYLIPIMLMPAGIFSHLMTRYRTAHRPVAERVMFICSLAYVLFFMTLWSSGIFEYVQGATSPSALYPALVWGAAGALTPLLWWASRDRANLFVCEMVEVAQVAVLVLALLRLVGIDMSFGHAFLLVGAIMVFAAGGEALYEKKYMKHGG